MNQDAEVTAAEAPSAALPADPRAAITEFLTGMNAFALSDFLDVAARDRAFIAFGANAGSQDPARLAQQLYSVLNRTALIDVMEFPVAGDAALAGGAWSWAHIPPSEPDVEIELGFVTEGSGWVLSAETLQRVPTWAAALQGALPVDEFLDNMPTLERVSWRLRNLMPDVLRERPFLLELWQWLGIVLLVIFGVVGERVFTNLLARLARRAAGRVALDEQAIGNFRRPFGLLMTAAIFRWTLPVLGLDPEHHRILLFAAGFALAVASVWTAYRVVDVVCAYLRGKAALTDNTFDDLLVPLLDRTLKILITIAGLVYVASLLSGDLYGIIAGLSIGGMAFAFAAQESIKNLFGTFTVLLDKPFALGDYVSIGSVEGTVEAVGFSSTRVRTSYDSLITVPNSRFITTDVDNYGARQQRRIKTVLGLTYDTPPAKLEAFCEGVRELIRRHPHTRKDSFHVYVNEFGANSIDVMLYCFIVTKERKVELRERERLFLDILRLAEALKVEFAFPTRTVHMLGAGDMPDHADAPASGDEAGERGRQIAAELLK
jgi:MscS family membrane protein